MGIASRLNKLEKLLTGAGCAECAAREMATVEDQSAWLALFFAKCGRCNRQRTWLDLALLAETYTGKR